MRMRSWPQWIVVLAVSLPFSAAAKSPEELRGALQAAIRAYEDGMRVVGRDDAQAQRHFRDALAGFEAVRVVGVRSAALEYNLANAHFRTHSLGQAIVHYRRALVIDPSHADAQANLQYVRAQVEPRFPASAPGLWERLLFWHYQWSRDTRLTSAATFSALGWICLALRLRWPAQPLVIGGLASIGLGLIFSASFLVESFSQAREPAAVVIQKDTLRHGRGETYEPVLQDALGPGVELIVQERRGGWSRVQLPGGVTGWLPDQAIQVI